MDAAQARDGHVTRIGYALPLIGAGMALLAIFVPALSWAYVADGERYTMSTVGRLAQGYGPVLGVPYLPAAALVLVALGGRLREQRRVTTAASGLVLMLAAACAATLATLPSTIGFYVEVRTEIGAWLFPIGLGLFSGGLLLPSIRPIGLASLRQPRYADGLLAAGLLSWAVAQGLPAAIETILEPTTVPGFSFTIIGWADALMAGNLLGIVGWTANIWLTVAVVAFLRGARAVPTGFALLGLCCAIAAVVALSIESEWIASIEIGTWVWVASFVLVAAAVELRVTT